MSLGRGCFFVFLALHTLNSLICSVPRLPLRVRRAALSSTMHTLKAGHALRTPHGCRAGRQQRQQRAAAAGTAAAAADTQTTSFQLSPQQVEQFQNDGFLAIPGFASQQQVEALMERAGQLVEGFDAGAAAGFSVFSTQEDQRHAKDAYFLDSASQINFFFEEKARFDDEGRLLTSKELSINKIGHALHDLDPVFRGFARSPAIAGVLRSLGYQRPLPVQSMFIFKQPVIGGEVTPHQDSCFLYTDPPSCIGLWLALQDANRSNGCLWGLKGVHKQGLARRFRRLPEGGVGFDGPAATYELSAFEPIECAAGTLVLLHGENVHYSAENTSPVSRHSLALHFVESGAGHEWAADNWAHSSNWQPLYDQQQQQQ